MAVNVSENTSIALPIRNLLAIVGAAIVGVWSYFGIVETLNKHSTTLELMQKDLELNTEFRIQTPKELLKQEPINKEIFMILEWLSGENLKINEELLRGRNNTINIDHLTEQVSKLSEIVEKLKDSQREIKYKNGY